MGSAYREITRCEVELWPCDMKDEDVALLRTLECDTDDVAPYNPAGT